MIRPGQISTTLVLSAAQALPPAPLKVTGRAGSLRHTANPEDHLKLIAVTPRPDLTMTAETHEVTGQMVIPVVAGDNQVRVKFTRTWDRTAGGVVSAGALLLTIGLLMFHRRQQH